MIYSIGLYFDSSTENVIRSIWQAIAEVGVSDYLHLSANRPHFTVAIFVDLDVPQAKVKLAEIASENEPMSILFSSIGCFPALKPDLFLGPVVTPELLEFHKTINQRFDRLGTYPDFNYYRPGYWVPHCALAMEIDSQNTQAVLDITRERLKFPSAPGLRKLA